MNDSTLACAWRLVRQAKKIVWNVALLADSDPLDPSAEGSLWLNQATISFEVLAPWVETHARPLEGIMDRECRILRPSLALTPVLIYSVANQWAMGQSAVSRTKQCAHAGGRIELPSGSIGATWVNPRNGPQLFYNTFHNQTSVLQTFSQEVRGEVLSSFDGTLALGAACVRVGTSVMVSLSRAFPVSIPPGSSVTMTAYANMMNRSIEIMNTCGACHEVISVKNNWVTSARGINEYFKK